MQISHPYTTSHNITHQLIQYTDIDKLSWSRGPGRSPPNPSTPHDAIKLIHTHAPRNAHAAIRLENHILEQLLVHILLEHGSDAAQVGQRDGPVGAVCEELEGLGELRAVSIRTTAAVARVELERADGEEGLVGGVAVGFGVENGDEFLELGGRRGGDAEGAVERVQSALVSFLHTPLLYNVFNSFWVIVHEC